MRPAIFSASDFERIAGPVAIGGLVQRIIDLASTGVIDVKALRNRVVAESQAVATVYSTLPRAVLARSLRTLHELIIESL
jgi:hypothetical protein